MFKQNEKHCQKANLCDVKYRFLIIAIHFVLYTLFFILLYMFNMYNQEIFASITCSSITGFYILVFICVFGGRCPGHVSGMFTVELLYSGS